jgi:hypothetical protein
MVKSRKLELIKIFLCFFWIILLIGCTDNSTEPEDQVEGIRGKVYDTDGKPVSGANIYCLFYLTYIPSDVTSLHNSHELSAVDSFPFQLFQTFPNPCSQSFYLRFSLPEECTTTITIYSKKTHRIVYQDTEIYPYGLFQFYFDKIVDSLHLTNGIYHYQLNANGKSGFNYQDDKSILVISDTGTSNYITDSQGNYVFNKDDAFIGDTVTVMNGDQISYTRILDKSVHLLVLKDGYQSKVVSFELLPGVLLQQDIILMSIP